MRLPGLKAMRRTADWLHSRVANFVLILAYHRVAETAIDPYDLCVRPDHFAEQMDILRRQATVVDIHTITDGLKSGRLPGGRWPLPLTMAIWIIYRSLNRCWQLMAYRQPFSPFPGHWVKSSGGTGWRGLFLVRLFCPKA